MLSKGDYDADTNRQQPLNNGAVHELAEVSACDYRRNNELVSAGIMEFVIEKLSNDDIFMDNMFNSIEINLIFQEDIHHLTAKWKELKKNQVWVN